MHCIALHSLQQRQRLQQSASQGFTQTEVKLLGFYSNTGHLSATVKSLKKSFGVRVTLSAPRVQVADLSPRLCSQHLLFCKDVQMNFTVPLCGVSSVFIITL